MVWDEGNAIGRASQVSAWIHQWSPASLRDGGRPWTAAAIADGWPYTTVVEGHPAFYGLLIAVGSELAPASLSPLARSRFGPVTLFAIAIGAVSYRVTRERSSVAALAGVAAVLTLPRLLAHANFASFDGPLTSAWLLAWAVWPCALRSWRGTVLFGAMLGMTLSAKATGWLAPPAFLLGCLLAGDRPAVVRLAAASGIAVLVFLALNPPLWHQPLSGTGEFFSLNLNRAARPEHNVSTQFFGRLYNLDYPLPWYNSLVWTAIAVPAGTLLLAVVGAVGAFGRLPEARFERMLLAQWFVPVLVRALPGVPPHDGIRLFLPSFVFLALLAGLGANRLLSGVNAWCGAKSSGVDRAIGRFGVAASLALWLASCMATIGCLWPQLLSHYNLLVGGTAGAVRAGMEPTYYWDSLDDEVLDWLNGNVTADEKVFFAAAPTENLALLRRWDELRVSFLPDDPGVYKFYCLQHRPSTWLAADRWLVEYAEPVFRKSLTCGPRAPWTDAGDVTLLSVFTMRQFVQAQRASDVNRTHRREVDGRGQPAD